MAYDKQMRRITKMRLTYKPAQFEARKAKRTKGARRSQYSIDAVALWQGKPQTGNRSALRAAKLMGIFDGSAGERRTPRASATSIPGVGNMHLREVAYEAGYRRGEAHRSFIKGIAKGEAFRTGKKTKPAVKEASKLVAAARKRGDVPTIKGFRAGYKPETYKGPGRNTGSFKGRAGQWKKGPGGRFVGSK